MPEAVVSVVYARSRHKRVFVVRMVMRHHWLVEPEESVLKPDPIVGTVEDLSDHPGPCYLLKGHLVDSRAFRWEERGLMRISGQICNFPVLFRSPP